MPAGCRSSMTTSMQSGRCRCGALVTASKLLTRWGPLELLSNLGIAAVLEVTDRALPESWGSGLW